MTFEQYSALVRQIIPHNVTIRREKLVPNGKGFIIDLAEQKSANFIFGPSFIQELNRHNMTAELTFDTARTRLVFLTDVHQDIYCKEPSELIEEIKRASGKHIYKVHKFPGTGNNSDCKYITATADSRLSRDCIVREGYLNIFDKRVQTEFPKPKGRSHPPTRTQSGHDHEQTYPTRPNHRNHETTNLPPRRENVWHRNRPHFQTQQNAIVQRYNDQYPLPSETTRPRNHENQSAWHPDFKSEFHLDFYIKMSESICNRLQGGLENPEDYLNAMNNISANYSIPTIIVPNEDLVLARDKFLCKANTTNTSLNTNTYPTNSLLNNTHPTNSLSMPTDNDPHTSPSILNPTEPLNSLNLQNASDPSSPPTDLSNHTSMPTPTDPSTNTSMTNENDPQNSPSMSNDTDPTNLSSLPNDSESSIPSSMTNNTNPPAPPTPPPRSPPKNPSSSSVTSKMILRKQTKNLEKQTKK